MKPAPVVFIFVVIALLLNACGGAPLPQAVELPEVDTPTISVPSQTLPPPAADTPIPPTETLRPPEPTPSEEYADEFQLTNTPIPRPAQMTRVQIAAPAAVRGMQAVYVPDRKIVVLFGGVDQQGKILDETWEFNGQDWKKVNPATKPPPRFWQGMAYDADRKVVVMFGGNKNFDGHLFSDTWEYDGKNWKQINTPNRPPDRGENPAIAYDSCRKRIVLYGGRSFAGPVSSTWEYDGKDWENVLPRGKPWDRSLTAMVFDSQRCRMVLFGGMDANVVGYQDTWEYDGETWRERKSENVPPARWAHAMTYDPGSGRTLLYGGTGPQHPGSKLYRDAWVFDGEGWEQVSLASNFDVEQHILVFHVQQRYALLYAHGQTWKINPGSMMAADDAPAANCALGFTRLAIGKNAQPAGAITLANNIRSEPKIASNIIGSFVPGMFVKISDGPVCADGFVFWKVESRLITGGTGWTAEGDGKQYFLEPLE
jgi:hypothetical protein